MAAKQWPTSADGTSTEASLSQSDGPAIESDSSPEYYSCDGPTVDETEYSSVLEHVEENQPESSGERSDGLPGGMEHDDSVLFLLTSHDVKALKNGVRPDGGPSFATPATPRAATCDVMVGGDASRCTSAVTQTEGPETADKDVLTEVHMANLDALMKEFTKLNMVEEKLRWQTEELKSSTLRKECNCLHRAQRAELGLLALQYSMCRQHCWKLHCTSSEGGRLSPTPDSSNIESVLQKLEREYNAMREEIRAGVPLEQLEPLSVDPEKMTTRPRYVPAKIIRDVLGNVPSGSSQQQHKASGEEHDHRSSNGSQDNLKGIKMETGGARRAAPLAPQDGGATHNAHEPEEKRTAASPELGACEAWYDAEEDLHRAGAAREPTAGAEEEPREATSEEGQSAAVLRVSNLPSGVTESDVTLWSEEHRSSDVSISALENGLRVAMVTVSGPLSAETGVRELQGRPVQAEHVHRRASESSKEPGQPQSCGTEGKRTARPPLGSRVKNWKVVSVSPTAEGTFVPPHYGTMGSFDSLMAALTRRHPAAGRQSIVDALVELKAERGGVLSGLPLATIRDMASELLTRPANATWL